MSNNFLSLGLAEQTEEVTATIDTCSAQTEDFHKFFCVQETEIEEFNKRFWGADALMLIPGEEVVGKGLRNRMKQCVIFVRKGGQCFAYHNGEQFESELIQPLPQNCVLIFLGEAKEAYILIQDNGSGQKLYHFEDDVEIDVFLETEGYKGRNGYYACVIKDSWNDLQMCSITADPKTAEFMLSFYMIWTNGEEKNE